MGCGFETLVGCSPVSWLAKWRNKCDARRDSEDELARVAREVNSLDEVLQRYKSAMEESAGKKKQMKKEWKDDEAASFKGGGWSWPVGVVQLICEFLVIGTPPSSTPGNIRIMYETLYDIDLDAEGEKRLSFLVSIFVLSFVLLSKLSERLW